MKRSRVIKLVLAGGISAGALTGCEPSRAVTAVSETAVYPNNYQVPGVGYYHAPFREFYPQPYNAYDAQRKMYYHGGKWNPAVHQSVINVSAPSAQAVKLAEASRTDIRRSGFGSTGSHYSSFSS